MLLGLTEAVIPPWPVFHYRKRADDQIGGGLGDAFQKANLLAETVEVIGLPFIFPLPYLDLIYVAFVSP